MTTEDNNNNQLDEHALILSHLGRRDFWLTLPEPMERDFCRDQDRRSADGVNSTIAAIAVLYVGLGAALVLVSGFANLGLWPASYGVFLVLIMTAWLMSVGQVFGRHYQLPMTALVTVAVSFALVHPSLLRDGILVYLVHEGTIFVMVLVFLGLNLRLPWALAGSAFGALIALGIVIGFDLRVDWDMSASTFLGGAMLGVVLRYRDERYLRRDFLHARLLALDNQRIQAMADELERLSLLDGLTGLANRRYFDSSLDKAWRSCQRDKAPLTIIMVDVDFFKPYNDHYGHQQGDEALRTLATTISAQAVRPQDLVARYGGEEFVVLLPWVDEAAAAHMADRILQAVRDINMPHTTSTCADRITVSAGVATLVPSAEHRPAELVSSADGALYQAKHAGRDRWVKAAPIAGR
ncbi:MAG: GGDEF domain-containing protein [Alcanivoracaceae bacterium]